MSQALPRYESRVIAQRELAPGLMELTFARCGLGFQAGDEIQVHGDDPTQDRTYSLLSGTGDEHLQVLYRVIPEGVMTPRLARLRPGDALAFTGPFGHFHLRDPQRPVVFVATGTGIAPAVSFLRTHPALHLRLLHGVRRQADLCYRDLFVPERYHPCISREDVTGTFHGRVTSLFPTLPVESDADFFLCGANDMILAMTKLLKQQGVEDARVVGEAYYWW